MQRCWDGRPRRTKGATKVLFSRYTTTTTTRTGCAQDQGLERVTVEGLMKPRHLTTPSNQPNTATGHHCARTHTMPQSCPQISRYARSCSSAYIMTSAATHDSLVAMPLGTHHEPRLENATSPTVLGRVAATLVGIFCPHFPILIS